MDKKSIEKPFNNLTNIALGHLRGGVRETDTLMLAGELIGGVDLLITIMAQRRLISATKHRGFRRIAHVTVNFHLLIASSAAVLSKSRILRNPRREKENVLSCTYCPNFWMSSVNAPKMKMNLKRGNGWFDFYLKEEKEGEFETVGDICWG